MRLRQSHVINTRWYLLTVTPWILSIGVLVSTTASADFEVYFGRSIATKNHFSTSLSLGNLIPPSNAEPGLDMGSMPMNIQFNEYDPDYAFAAPLYILPNNELKSGIKNGKAVIDRSEKGEPIRPVSTSLSRRAVRQYGMLFYQPPVSLQTEKKRTEPYRSASARQKHIYYQNILSTSSIITHPSASIPSPATIMTGSTGSGISLSRGDGSTPALPRAQVLSSVSPVPLHLIPEEVGALPVSVPEIALNTERNNPAEKQPNFATLVSGRNASREERCLAEAIYFEARSEPPAGQAAVAQVVLNRVRSSLYPASICGVVYQNAHRHLSCQFTFACEGKSLKITEPASWAQAQKIAKEVLEGKTYLANVGGATHYHANYVRPYWSRKLNRKDKIGRHIFYQLKPGQR